MLTDVFKSVLLMSAAGSLLSAILLALKPATKKYFSPRWQYYMWLAVLVVFILPLSLTLPQNLSALPEIKDAEPLEQQITVFNQYEPTAYVQAENDVLPAEFVLEDTPAPNSKIYLTQNAWFYLSVIWLVAAAAVITVKIIRYLMFYCAVNKNSYLSEEQSDIPKGLIVKKTDMLDSPMIIGLFKPVLFMPNAAVYNSEYILMHELTHFKRRDILYKWFAMLVLSLHWFNPCSSIISKQIDEECEISCDYEVTKGLSEQEKNRYMRTILELFENAAATPRLLTTQMASDKNIIKKRFAAIKESTDKSRIMILISLILSIILLLAALITSGILQGIVKTEPENAILAVNTHARTDEGFTFLVLGLDNDDRADCMMLFAVNDENINILSIPRKAAFNVAGEIKTVSQLLTETDSDQKIVNAVQENFMLPVNYYAKVNMSAAESIIDMLGGVEFNVPVDMSYEDPYQNLRIDLKSGLQILNGTQSMQLLRYRKGYAEGELARDEMHLKFLEAVIKQKANKEYLKILPDILEIAAENIQTNYSFKDAKKDIRLITDDTEENMTFYQLPGENAILDDKNMLIFQIDYQKSEELFKLFRLGSVILSDDKNAENLSEDDLKWIQTAVDNGHYPWRLNPEETAKEYMKKQGFVSGEVTALAGSATNCSVTYSVNGLSYIIDLLKPINQVEDGIWIVKNTETDINNFVFSDKEVEDAKAVVYEYYKNRAAHNREGVLKTMTPWHNMANVVLWQDEKIALKNLHYYANDHMRLDYIKNGRGSVNKTEYKNVIVLKADIVVTYNEGEKSAWSQGEYDWNLILIRDNENSKWLIDDMGW